VAVLAETSFRALERDAPDAFERLCAQLAGQSLSVDLGDEVFTVTFDRKGSRVSRDAGAEATVRLATTRAAVGDLIDGRVGLAEAVEHGSIRLIGELDDLLTAHDGLRTYLHAAARTDSVPPLRDHLIVPTNPDAKG
jgi:hypothetical protein